MRRYLLASVCVLPFLTGAALAADLPSASEAPYSPAPDTYQPPVFTWTGFYAGGNFGWASGRLTTFDRDGWGAGTIQSFGKTTDGFVGGAQGGYNWQSGAMVFGAEADLGAMGIGGRRLERFTTTTTNVGIHSGLYGDLTGRVGVALGQALLYGKGGWAFYNGDSTFSTLSAVYAGNTNTGTWSGWTLGAGLEYAITPNVSIKAEYQFFDFGHQNFIVTSTAPATFRFREGLQANTIKLGLNWMFH